MSRLPVCSGASAVKAFRKLGYELDHQTGSHIILRHPSGRRLTVPNHREIAKGTLDKDLRVTIPKNSVPPRQLNAFLDWLRLEEITQRSRLTQEEGTVLDRRQGVDPLIDRPTA